ncbi:MAG: HAD family hydrolase [Candidatus Omnitrophota bacterium]|nr:HAD family hydrolase [Candidatus Omnitrophota bacterium]
MLKGIKLVIFDLDGTLIDAYDAIAESFNYAMRQINSPTRSYAAIKKAVGWGDRGLLLPFVSEAKLEKALKIYQAHHKQSLFRLAHFLPGALFILKYLKGKGYKIAVASNRPKAFTRIIVKRLNLRNFFDYILCGDELKRAKPYPDILLKILRKFALKKDQAIYVGDMTIDVNTGKNAGIKTLAVTTGSSSKKELADLKPFIHSRPQNRTLQGAPACPTEGRRACRTGRDRAWPLSISLQETTGFSPRSFILLKSVKDLVKIL